MPFTIQKLAEGTRVVTVHYDGDQGEVEYKLGAYNAEYYAWLDKNIREQRQREQAIARGEVEDVGEVEEIGIREMLERVLVSWDVTGPDGQPISTTATAMREYNLPTPFLRAVQQAIVEDQDPKSLKAKKRR